MIQPVITYFFRHPRPEYHSIERLFGGLADYINQHTGRQVVRQVHCPHSQVTPLNLLRNCLSARRQRGSVNHITGDVHYLALALPKRSTILTIHDCVLLTRYSKWHPMHWFHFYVWYKWPISRAGLVTTISDNSKAELVRVVGVSPDKIKVIANFYDPRFFPDESSAQPNRQPVILQVGTGPHKNLERLIAAVAGLPCRLVVIGQLTDLQKQLLLIHQVEYQELGNVDFPTVHQAYLTADLVAFVSLYEGFGLPILEAQTMNKPLITSNMEPMRTIAGEGASLVDPTDVAAIRTEIERILADPTYRAGLLDSGQINARRYSIDRIAGRYVALYNSLHALSLVL